MLKLNVLKTAGISAAIGLFIPIAVAQQPAATPSGPVPSQILHAKKIFIVNAEGDNDARISKYVGGTNGIYDQFYADVKNLGRFELVSAPADADVVFEVTLTVLPSCPAIRDSGCSSSIPRRTSCSGPCLSPSTVRCSPKRLARISPILSRD